jgi:hypothetical protein
MLMKITEGFERRLKGHTCVVAPPTLCISPSLALLIERLRGHLFLIFVYYTRLAVFYIIVSYVLV